MRILIAPLDWGLGHATRCIPIIKQLLSRGHQVYLASSGPALRLLQLHFPQLPFLSLPAYQIRYPYQNAVLNFLQSQPNIIAAIIKEHRLCKQFIKLHEIEFLISDNRFGCHVKHIPCIYITHQLRFHFRNPWLSKLAALAHFFWYRNFAELWIPDTPPPGNLSGDLSLQLAGPPVRHIGILSQLEKIKRPQRYEALFLLSGPEPQRTYLEQKIIVQVKQLKGRFLLVRGLPKAREHLSLPPNLKVFNFLGPERLAEEMAAAALIICRSGYSSIMDLKKTARPAILIPTPGQPEQLYLADHLSTDPQFLVMKQDQLRLVAFFEKPPVDLSALNLEDAPSEDLLLEALEHWKL